MSFDIRITDIELPDGWTTVSIKDVATINAETIKKKTEPDFIHYIDISSVSNSYYEEPKSMPYKDAPSRAKRIVKENDIIISTVRPNLRQHVLLENVGKDWVASTGFAVVSATDDFNAWYLYSFLTSDLFNEHLVRVADGGAYPAFNPKEIEDAIIPWPSPKDLSVINSTVRSFYKKIALNTQINQTLESMAQALFKSWFVDFDPVKAKIAVLESGGTAEAAELAAMSVISGKDSSALAEMQTANPKAYDQLKTTASLFPSQLVESELGMIPEGWEVKTVGDITKFPSNRVSVSELDLDNYISTENMVPYKSGISTASSLPTTPTTPQFESGHILVSNIRPYFQKIWLATFSGGRSNDVLGFIPKHNGTSEYVYHLMYQDSFFAFMMATSKGAKMPRGDKDAIMGYQLAYNLNVALHFSEKVKEFKTLAAEHKKESNALSVTRDSLLPKLLTGEIDLSSFSSFGEVGE